MTWTRLSIWMGFRGISVTFLALGLASAPPAVAQTQGSGPPEQIESIVVIGSRARAEKPADDLPVPVDVYGEVEIERVGEVDLSAALAKLSPSFNLSRNSVGDGGLLHPATLRGLSPDQTLVLVNGKRRHSMAFLRVLDGMLGYGTGGTDLRAIPGAAIARVEVLRDGAAAQYGSDAIAGVINLQLQERSEGGDVTLYAARTGESDGERAGVSFNAGLPLGSEGGFLSLSGEWYDENALERNRRNAEGDVTMTDNSPDYDNQALFFNAELPLGDAGEIYAFGGWSEREGNSSGAYRYGFDSIFTFFRGRNTHPVYPDGFLPYEESEIEDLSLALGWRGELAGWDADLSAAYGQNEFRFGVSNSINASIGADYLAMNPGAVIAAIVANAGPLSGDSGGVEFDQLSINLDLRREFELGGRPLHLAAGLEHREENYQQNAGEEASWSCGQPHNTSYRAFAVGPDGTPLDGTLASCGFQGYPGYSPTNAALSDDDRDSQAAYLDLEFEPTGRWSFGAALRWEDYSDAGSETTGKLATRFRISDEFALRGAFSTGFRAPSLSQRRFNSIVFSASAETGLTTTFFAPEGHEIARFYGVDALEHETSENWSAGFVWTPSENFRLTLDAFRTEVDDRVVRSLGIGCGDIAACQQQNASSTAFFFNGIDTRTRGLDVSAQWNAPLAGGDLRVSASAHFNENEITGESLPAGAPGGMEFADYFGGWPADLLERGQPRNQFNLTADWSLDSLGATVRLNRYGRTEQNPLGVGAWDVDAATTADVEGRYDFGGGLHLKLGIDNVFDELPDELEGHDLMALWGIRYPTDAPPYGLAGRLFYTRLSYRF